MSLTEKIKHIFRSSGTTGNNTAFCVREVVELLPEANPHSVKDIICRLERQGYLIAFRTAKTHARKFIINTDSAHAIPLWKLIDELSTMLVTHGVMMVYTDRKLDFRVVDDGDISYISLKNTSKRLS